MISITSSLKTATTRTVKGSNFSRNAAIAQLKQSFRSVSVSASSSSTSSPSSSSSFCNPNSTFNTRSFHSGTTNWNGQPTKKLSSQAEVWENISKTFKPAPSRTPSSFSSASPPSSSSSSSPSSSNQDKPFQSFVQLADQNFKKRVTLGHSVPNDPTSGRQVLVSKNEVERAYRQLSSILKRNNLRRELKLGERYEKPNEMRRRKRSERHRRRFKDLVRTKVQLAMALKARGA